MRLLIVILSITVTEVLGIVVFHLPETKFCLSLLPMGLVAGWLAYKEERA